MVAKLSKNHLGRAGHLAGMAEFLLLGYNVAIPEVDQGDDIFVVDDHLGELWRVQVKTALPTKQKGKEVAQFLLPRSQLRTPKRVELYYVFALRRKEHFEFFVLSRPDLWQLRKEFERTSPREAKTEKLNLRIQLTDGDALGWNASLWPYRYGFSRYFPPLSK